MKKDKITVKQIFDDNFKEFWKNNNKKFPEEMRANIYDEVMKMVGCSNILSGFVAYICIICLKVKKIGFTCKSRFCNKCGKKYASQWVEKQADKILKVPHRHCVFIVPK